MLFPEWAWNSLSCLPSNFLPTGVETIRPYRPPMPLPLLFSCLSLLKKNKELREGTGLVGISGHMSAHALVLHRRQVNNEITDFVHGAGLLRSGKELEGIKVVATDEGKRRFIYRGVLNKTSKKSILLSAAQVRLARAKIDRILRQGAKGAKRLRHKKAADPTVDPIPF